MGGGDFDRRRRRLPARLYAHGRLRRDFGGSVARQGPHLGADQAAEQVLRGPRQGAPGLRQLSGRPADPGRGAGHAPERMRRRHRRVRRAVARGRTSGPSRRRGTGVNTPPLMSAPARIDVLAGLWRSAGLDEAALRDISFSGAEPVLPSSFAVGTAAQATIGAAALAAAALWRLRSGRRQHVTVDMRAAGIEFRSERYLRVDGKVPDEYHDAIAGLYRCGDGRWVRLHTNLPHHCSGLLELVGCEHDRAAVTRTLQNWRAEDLEDAAAAAGLVVTACRSFTEWDAHAQGRALAQLPPFSIERIGDAPRQPLPAAARPLSGVKVLDLTRIIAGPVCGRTLAAHGADVLLVTAGHLPSVRSLVVDTGRGKLSAAVDLRQNSGREALAALLRDADVIVQGYRPGAIASHGFS